MKLKALLLLVIFSLSCSLAFSQSNTIHKVKKHETIFGIAREYGISIDELIEANPDMRNPGYDLKKGDMIVIPAKKTAKKATTAEAATPAVPVKSSVDVGIMLPLHDVDGDGRRMVEYYRGILMAVEKMKGEGISINVHAWNVPIDADIRTTLLEKDAQKLDIIFGPLYSRQVKALGDFCTKNKIRMVIPFSISSNEVDRNPNIYQIYQSQQTISDKKNLRKVVSDYRRTRSTIDAHKKLSGRKAENYRQSHEAEFIIYEAALRQLKVLAPGKKLPATSKLNTEIEALISEKNAAYNTYRTAKAEYEQLATAKRNAEQILHGTPSRQKKHEQER